MNNDKLQYPVVFKDVRLWGSSISLLVKRTESVGLLNDCGASTWLAERYHDHAQVEDVKFRLWRASKGSHNYYPYNFSLWKDLRSSGDGYQVGTLVKDGRSMAEYLPYHFK